MVEWSKARRLFGASLEVAPVGAAPIAPDLLELFHACGVLVLAGHDLTETCAAATINTADAVRFGPVGRALPGTEVAIAEDGEILIRGPLVFKGYYQDPAATSLSTSAAPQPLDRVNRKFARIEQTKRFAILDHARLYE